VTTRLLLAAVVAAGTAWLPATTASACDPNRFPNCQTYCGAIASRYQWLQSSISTDPPLPDWPHTGVAGCP
jgi:hypothetical protein